MIKKNTRDNRKQNVKYRDTAGSDDSSEGSSFFGASLLRCGRPPAANAEAGTAALAATS